MSEFLQVKLSGRDVPVRIGKGNFASAFDSATQYKEIALITDDVIAGQPWFADLEKIISKKATRYLKCIVPHGEEAKSISQYADLCSQLAREKFTRSTTVVALGGGVIGDLAGFVAASYLRGVKLIQVPTTLLAAVDSCLGGKTGVNLPEGKNLVGSIHQPEAIIVDTAFLETLPESEIRSGMAEVIKHGFIRDAELLDQLLSEKKQPLEKLIHLSLQIKAAVVTSDERETLGYRILLNYGHTIGHALEQATDYKRWAHGEAVAIGMMGAAYLSEKIYGISCVDLTRKALELHRLPTGASDIDHQKAMEALYRDKKSTGDRIRWVLLEKIGHAVASDAVDRKLAEEALNFCLK
jgi:3-dehydroquinate synthase